MESRRVLAAHIAGDATIYATIQSAVDAAAPGATIDVDAGVYPELVSVFKTLTIRGARAGVDGRSNIRTDTAGESVVSGEVFADGSHASAFFIAANDVSIDGFTARDNSSGTYGAGIVIAPNICGAHILNNVVVNNIAGLYLANSSATDAALIQHNLFRSNNVVGVNDGRGIYTDGGVSGGYLTNVTIDSNAFFRNEGAINVEPAIGLESRTLSSQSNIRITNNVFDSNGKAVLAYNIDNLLIDRNTVAFCRDTTSGALRFEGGASNVTITHNTLYDSEARAIRIDKQSSSGDNFNFAITANNIFGNGQGTGVSHDGLYVDPGVFTGTINATNNWWGSASGPAGDGPGGGDAVYANGNGVDVSTWASAPFANLQLPYAGAPSDVNCTIEAENFDHGGREIAYHDTTVANLGDRYRPYEAVDIEADSDVDAGFDVTLSQSTEWLAYTVKVPISGIYDIGARVATSQLAGGVFHVAVDDNCVSGPINIPGTGGDQVWQTISQSGVTLPAGVHVLKIIFDAGGTDGAAGNLNWFKFSLVTPTQPTNLRATIVGANIDLAWTNNNPDATKFIVEKKTGSGAWEFFADALSNTFSDTRGFAPAMSYAYRVRAVTPLGETSSSNEASVITPATQPAVYLSDLGWTTAANGFGPVEKDMSNGGSNAGDGSIITLNGLTYARGLGVHADSDIVYRLAGQYASLLSDVGIDDEAVGGSVRFQVFFDDATTAAFDSGLMLGTSLTQTFNLDVRGVNQLRLHVDNGGDDFAGDHADWAGARLIAAHAAMATTFPPAATSSKDLLRMDNSSHTRLEIVHNGTLQWTAPLSDVSMLTFQGGAGDDTLTIDSGNGKPVPIGNVFYDGGAGNNWLIVHGSGGSAVTLASGAPGPTSGIISVSSTAKLSLTVQNAVVTIDGPVLDLESLAISDGGKIDLSSNALIIRTGVAGSWNGSAYDGITALVTAGSIFTSQSSASAIRGRTTIGVASAGDALGIAAAATGLWKSITINAGAVLLRYTYVGDADLSGAVTGDDFFRIDSGFAAQAGGFGHGDFDYNGRINADDYFWIDSTSANQGPAL